MDHDVQEKVLAARVYRSTGTPLILVSILQLEVIECSVPIDGIGAEASSMIDRARLNDRISRRTDEGSRMLRDGRSVVFSALGSNSSRRFTITIMITFQLFQCFIHFFDLKNPVVILFILKLFSEGI